LLHHGITKKMCAKQRFRGETIQGLNKETYFE
jgi:hypothetical protein